MGNCMQMYRTWKLMQSPRDIHDAESQRTSLRTTEKMILERIARNGGVPTAAETIQLNMIREQLDKMDLIVEDIMLRVNRGIAKRRNDVVGEVAKSSSSADRAPFDPLGSDTLREHVALMRTENGLMARPWNEATTIASGGGRGGTGAGGSGKKLPLRTAEPVYSIDLDSDDDDDGDETEEEEEEEAQAGHEAHGKDEDRRRLVAL